MYTGNSGHSVDSDSSSSKSKHSPPNDISLLPFAKETSSRTPPSCTISIGNRTTESKKPSDGGSNSNDLSIGISNLVGSDSTRNNDNNTNVLPQSVPTNIFSFRQFHFILTTFINEEIQSNTTSIDAAILVPSSNSIQSMFYSVHEVELSNSDFVFRFNAYAGFDEPTYFYAIIYLERIKKDYPQLALNELNFHRLFLTSLVVSAKVVQDTIHPQSHYGRVGGVGEVKELNRLEMIFLKFLNHDLYVSPDEYNSKVDSFKSLLEERAPQLLEEEPVLNE